MTDLDQLEKLSRLRESGALTEEEFQTEKRRLLDGEPAKSGALKYAFPLAGLGIILVIVLTFLLVQHLGLGRQLEDKPTPGSTAVAETTENIIAPLPEATETTVPVSEPKVGYQWAMSSDVIGLNPAYVEGKLGAAKEKSSASISFEVEGCTVLYTLKGSQIVAAFTLVNAKCQPTIEGKKITPSTTFGSLMGSEPQLLSNCIYNCGNAYDPSIDLYQPGYHANGFIEVAFQGSIGDATSKAMDQWASAIRVQHGLAEDDYANSNYEWFQCVSNPPKPVVATMRAERVAGVSIGRNLNSCLP
jgi:hypothetical protein